MPVLFALLFNSHNCVLHVNIYYLHSGDKTSVVTLKYVEYFLLDAKIPQCRMSRHSMADLSGNGLSKAVITSVFFRCSLTNHSAPLALLQIEHHQLEGIALNAKMLV